MQMSRSFARRGGVVALVVSLAVPAFGQASFELLETPEPARWADFSLSRDGQNMGCLLGGTVYWWTAHDGFRHLAAGSPSHGDVSMSAQGNALVAARATASGAVPTIWFQDGTTLAIGTPGTAACPDKSGDDQSFDLNADGSLAVGSSRNCDRDVGFVWSPRSGPRELAATSHPVTRGVAVSADGQIIVGYCEGSEAGVRLPAMWRGDSRADLFLGHERAGEARNISLDGEWIVGQADMGGLSPQAFLWTAGQDPVGLGNLSGHATDASLASAVSDDGRVVGWSGDELWGTQEAFVWTAQAGMRSLADILAMHGVDLPAGLKLTGALDISGDGTTVVGVCRDKNWNQLYWRVRLGNTLMPPPRGESGSWRPHRTTRALPDSLGVQNADLLFPFPFGKRRY
jgi:probable HAF family extracellular repeat protein